VTIFKRKVSEEYLTVAEVKELLQDVEAERAADEERELRYELTRAIQHVNQFARFPGSDGRALVEDLLELGTLDDAAAHKVADLLPEDRDELRAVFAKERYGLEGDELDDVLNVVSRYK
jgi:DNA-directed RNA polymerase subunit F